MRITVEDLLYLDCMNNCTVLAGKKGIMNEVSWFLFYMHTGSVLPWIHGKELIFIYGSDFERNDDQLLRFLDECVEKEVSAVVFIEGKYLKKVSPAIITKAEEINIPLIFMPDKIPFVDITREMAEVLIREEEKKQSKNEILRTVIFGYDRRTEIYQQEFALAGFHIKNYNFIVRMQFYIKDIRMATARINSLNRYMKDYLEEYPHFIYEGNHIVFLFSCNYDNALERVEDFSLKLKNQIINEQKQKVIIEKIGISFGFDEISEIKKAFENAQLALDSVGISERTRDDILCSYDRVENVVKLLLETGNDVDMLRNCFKDTIEKIIQYDTEHKSELLNTLQIFLQEDGNIVRSADKLFIHRNTMNYRIGRINMILGLSIEDTAARYELKSALYYYKYYMMRITNDK